MKEKWTLINRINSHGVDYDFPTLEKQCKRLIKSETDKYYCIEYYQGDKLIESVEVTDYFN